MPLRPVNHGRVTDMTATVSPLVIPTFDPCRQIRTESGGGIHLPSGARRIRSRSETASGGRAPTAFASQLTTVARRGTAVDNLATTGTLAGS